MAEIGQEYKTYDEMTPEERAAYNGLINDNNLIPSTIIRKSTEGGSPVNMNVHDVGDLPVHIDPQRNGPRTTIRGVAEAIGVRPPSPKSVSVRQVAAADLFNTPAEQPPVAPAGAPVVPRQAKTASQTRPPAMRNPLDALNRPPAQRVRQPEPAYDSPVMAVSPPVRPVVEVIFCCQETFGEIAVPYHDVVIGDHTLLLVVDRQQASMIKFTPRIQPGYKLGCYVPQLGMVYLIDGVQATFTYEGTEFTLLSFSDEAEAEPNV